MNYQKHYDGLMERARNRTLTGYSERHRIVPGCMGGTYVKENVVRLTPEEHYVAHLLLVKIHPGHYGLLWAAMSMTNGTSHQPRKNKVYGWLRRRLSAALSARMRGRKLSDEHRGKLRAAKLGKKRGPHRLETKAKMSAAAKGKPKSPEHRAALARAKMGNKNAVGPRTEEQRRRIADSLVGKLGFQQTVEYRQKHSQRMKEIWAQRRAGVLPTPRHCKGASHR